MRENPRNVAPSVDDFIARLNSLFKARVRKLA
jgi:hypothetical protein